MGIDSRSSSGSGDFVLSWTVSQSGSGLTESGGRLLESVTTSDDDLVPIIIGGGAVILLLCIIVLLWCMRSNAKGSGNLEEANTDDVDRAETPTPAGPLVPTSLDHVEVVVAVPHEG